MREAHRPVCGYCEQDMKPYIIGIPVVFYFQDPPQPYEAYMADLYRCDGCLHETAVGMRFPYIQHFKMDAEEEFAEALNHPNVIKVYEK